MQFSFSRREIKDIIYSTLAIGFIFAYGPQFSIVTWLLISLIVAISFIPHELAHKYVANKYNCFAQYQMWKSGLIIALIMTVFLGFAFIAPGAVVIYPITQDRYGIRPVNLTSKQNAIISAAGPLTNLLIALFFLPLAGMNPFFKAIVSINIVLALFNMIPFPPFDGSKIVWYSIFMWAALVAVGLVLFFVTGAAI